MSDDAELVDIYDDELRKVGVATRYEAHKKGLWHFNFHCWVVTRRGKGAVLFQVRSESKPSFPGLLDSTVGGHYRAGERSADVTREIEEELGVRAEMKDLVPLGRRVDVASYHGVSKREIAEVFLLECGRPLSEYRVDASEVVGLVEVPIDSGLRLFSGRAKRIPARGVMWDWDSGGLKDARLSLGAGRFVPKMDSYYMSLFVAAKRFLSGERYLSI